MKTVTRGKQTLIVEDTVSTASWRFWDLFANTTWEADTLRWVEKLQPGDLLIDIGAWVGPISLWAAKVSGARVIAIEPDPEAMRSLLLNIEANDLGELITPVACAISTYEGELDLLMTPGDPGDSKSSSYSRQMSDPTRISVPCRTIESIINEYGSPKMVKIDVEGEESRILPHSGEFLRSVRPWLALSTHYAWIAPDQRLILEAELENWERLEEVGELLLLQPRG